MSLTIYPALDILRGRAVRQEETSAGIPGLVDDDPIAIASRWREAGATWLHLIDLEGTLRGGPESLDLLKRVVAETGLAVQFGGGVRTEANVAAAFDAGAARVIVSAENARGGQLLDKCLARWGDRIAVSIDTRDGRVTVAGWLQSVSESALDFARRIVEAGARTLILTNMRGVDGSDAQQIDALVEARVALPETTLIAAGGFTTLEDARRLARVGIDGLVLGRPLYDGAVDLAEALRAAQEATAASDGDATPSTSDAPTA